jgi:tRNA threonylcarbamoyladenosine biosynthesis protein TsaB
VVLGMDTATASTAVALALGTGPVAELRDDPPAGAHPGHATRLLALAEQLLSAAGLGWGQVQRIAVGLGPGTFTGLRVGIASARGLAQARSIPLVGVSSLEALAAPALADGERDPGAAAGVLAVIDARRGEVFAAAYARGADGRPLELSVPRPVAPDAILTALPGDLAGEGIDTRAQAQGPAQWVAVGDGAVRYRAELEGAGLAVAGDSDPLHRVTAAAICALGASASPAGEVGDVLPDYRRRPDAELAFRDRRGRSPANASE